MQERLQKILSARGICSRRAAEKYILKGLVRVNGEKAVLGQKADPEHDQIEVDGAVIAARSTLLYYVMHKPVGVITSSAATFQRKKSTFTAPTLADLLPKKLLGKVFPVGRLDKDSSGLLLLTNDGVLAYRLTHPKFDHEKEYEVEVAREISDAALAKMERGMIVLGEKTKPARVRRLGERNFRIALTEGKNRQIRRMCKKVGSPVKHLKRIRIMTLEEHDLLPGKIRELTKKEREELLEAVGIR